MMRIEFPLIGGPHQVFHIAPVAAALSRIAPEAQVAIRADGPRALLLAQSAVAQFAGARVSLSLLERSRLGDALSKAAGRCSLRKVPLLWANRQVLNAADAVVVPECTSTALRGLGASRPLWFCVPHGAGDRAVSFEQRFRRFDHLLVAGEKTAEGMRGAGVDPRRLSVVGYPKADLMRRMADRPSRLFANDLPTVLYNPHFKRSLSSLAHAKALIEAFAAHPGFNLIFAPHIRAFEDDPAGRAALEALAVPGKVVVDCASDRLVDMTYVAAADIYLGDVSSQVYEFLIRPRPCVFVDAHRASWRGNADYGFWNLGEVAAPDEVVAAIERAARLHPIFLPGQTAALRATFGEGQSAAEAAAMTILAKLRQRREVVKPRGGFDQIPISALPV